MKLPSPVLRQVAFGAQLLALISHTSTQGKENTCVKNPDPIGGNHDKGEIQLVDHFS